MDELADHGPTRHLGGRSRHVAGDLRHAAPPRHRGLPTHRHCAGARHDHRCASRASGDDRRSATNRAQSCLRRPVRDPGWFGRVLSAYAEHLSLHDVGVVSRGNSRRLDCYWEFDGCRQTAGNSPPTSVDLQRPEPGQFCTARRRLGNRRIAGPASGGADMPTVISLLNGYAGLSAAAMGFVLDSKLLIIAGALDGSSGLILSIIMSKAMNRSFTNVLFGAFGQVQTSSAGAEEASPVRSATPEEAAAILSAANRVIVVPGYGMAVAQAQHKVRELYDALTKRGVDVRFAIHPVAGRMPGHMNVLLAEDDIPYDRLLEMDDITGDFPQPDVALVIGANDVTNPAARTDTGSPIFGMPILDVDKARTVMVIKRSMSPGFAGIDNPLYYLDKTLMLFGDAKAFVNSIVHELTASTH